MRASRAPAIRRSFGQPLPLSPCSTISAIALRTLRRRPTFTAAVVLTLALGIGTSSAVFSLLDAALIRPLPFADPSRLAMLWGVVSGPQRDIRGASYPEIVDWRTLNRSFSDVAAYDEISLNLGTGDEPRRVEAEMVSASYFGILGVSAARGRTFTAGRRSRARRRAGCRHQPRAVDDAVRVRSRHRRAGHHPQRPAVHHRRRHADGFHGISFDTDVWVPMMMISLTSSQGHARVAGQPVARGDRSASARRRPARAPSAMSTPSPASSRRRTPRPTATAASASSRSRTRR